MSELKISKLKYSGSDIAPVTVAEAVVVDGSKIPGLTTGVKRLDLVLTSLVTAYSQISTNTGNISTNTSNISGNTASIFQLETQVKALFEEGDGITATYDDSKKTWKLALADLYKSRYQLYNVVTERPNASAECLNKIYLVVNSSPSTSTENSYDEWVCVEKDGDPKTYTWEKVGSILSEIDLKATISALEGRVLTLEEKVNSLVAGGSIGIEPVKDTNLQEVTVNYTLNPDLWPAN